MCYSKKGFDNIREKLDDTKITDLIKQLKNKYGQEKMCKIFKISRAILIKLLLKLKRDMSYYLLKLKEFMRKILKFMGLLKYM